MSRLMLLLYKLNILDERYMIENHKVFTYTFNSVHTGCVGEHLGSLTPRYYMARLGSSSTMYSELPSGLIRRID